MKFKLVICVARTILGTLNIFELVKGMEQLTANNDGFYWNFVTLLVPYTFFFSNLSNDAYKAFLTYPITSQEQHNFRIPFHQD